GALNVVVERQQLIAIALENRPRVRGREVLPLQARVRELVLDRLHELVDEVEVRLTGDALVTPAEILGVLETLDVARPDVENDRQGALRADASDQRVEREFADRNTQTARPLIADAENPLAVGHDDDVDVRVGPIAQERWNGVAQRIRDEQAPGASVDVAELLTRQRDHRRVDDGRHFLDVIE